MPEEKYPVSEAVHPLVQDFSNAVMDWRFAALLLMDKAITARNAMIILQEHLMNDDKYEGKIDGMDGGNIGTALVDSMKVFDTARDAHCMARALGKKLGVPTPKNPNYSPEYVALAKKVAHMRLSPPPRR